MTMKHLYFSILDILSHLFEIAGVVYDLLTWNFNDKMQSKHRNWFREMSVKCMKPFLDEVFGESK